MNSTPVPKIIGSAALWLDASNINGNRNEGLNNGDYITNWIDLSGNGNDAIQSNNSYAPRLTDQDFNSQSSIMFDGSNDFLEIFNNLNLNSDDITILVLARQHNYEYTFSLLYDAGYNYNFGVRSSKAYINLNSSIVKNDTDQIEKGKWNYYVYQYKRGQGASVKFFDQKWNLSEDDREVPQHVLGSGNTYIGKSTLSGYSFKGKIAEILVFDIPITNQQLTETYHYLSKKWELQGSVDSDADGFVDSMEQDLNDDGDYDDDGESSPLDVNDYVYPKKVLDATLWFDASKISSFIFIDNKIQKWKSLAEDDNELYQSSSSRRPIYDELNSKVSFDYQSMYSVRNAKVRTLIIVHRSEPITSYLSSSGSLYEIHRIGSGFSGFSEYWINGIEQEKTLSSGTRYDNNLTFTNEKQISFLNFKIQVIISFI